MLLKVLSVAVDNKTTFKELFSFIKFKKMAEVLVDYSNRIYTDPELGTEVESIETHMEGNTTFATPSPTMIILKAQRIKYQTALAKAHNGTPTDTSDKNDQRAILEGMLHVFGPYVQLTSDGDETKILSTGMHTAASKGHIGEFGVVAHFRVIVPESSNKILCTCFKMPKASFYEVLYTALPVTAASVWMSETSTSSSIVINGLTSFIPYQFKMAARGSSKVKNFSSPITRAAN